MELGEQPVVDNWVYAGISEDTGQAMYVAPQDAGVMDWETASKAAADLQAQGMKDARVPSINELTQIFNQKSQIGGFNEDRADAKSWYWSSTSVGELSGSAVGAVRNFSDGQEDYIRRVAGDYRNHTPPSMSVRLVRSETASPVQRHTKPRKLTTAF